MAQKGNNIMNHEKAPLHEKAIQLAHQAKNVALNVKNDIKAGMHNVKEKIEQETQKISQKYNEHK